MQQHALINLLNSLESKGLLAKKVNDTIQDFLDYSTKSTGKLFLILCGLLGAAFISAGIFSLFAHNWDDIPKHIRGILSLLPSLIALYFYYLALFKHKDSTVWIESASFFLMMMIGASIALVSQTYNLDSDYRNLLKVWLVLSLPLLYLSKASGIATPYLILSCIFLFPDVRWENGRITMENEYAFYWIFFIAFIPHYLMALNKTSSKQGIRAIYLGWLIAFVLGFSMSLAFKGGHLYWALVLIVGLYVFGKKYYASNLSFLARPFQTAALYSLFSTLLMMSYDLFQNQILRHDNLRNFDSWDTERQVFSLIGLIALIALSIITFLRTNQHPHWNRYIIYTPFLLYFILIIFYLDEFRIVDLDWLGNLVLNFFILFFAINAMIQGNRYKNIFYMLYGLFLSGALLWMRYFDLDYSFWFKGLMFIAVGGMYFLINYLTHDEYEEV